MRNLPKKSSSTMNRRKDGHPLPTRPKGRRIASNPAPVDRDGINEREGTIEWGLALLLTAFMGLFAVAVSAQETDPVKTIALEALDHCATVFGLIGILYALNVFRTFRKLSIQSTIARVAVIFLVFTTTGVSSYINGFHSGSTNPKLTEFANASKTWQKEVEEHITKLSDLRADIQHATSEYNDCARQRDSLHVQLSIARLAYGIVEQALQKLNASISGFCIKERTLLNDLRGEVAMEKGKLDSALAKQPQLISN